MNKLLFTFCCSLFLICCQNRNEKEINSSKEKATEQEILIPQLFKIKSFNDTLIAFIKEKDSIPNPYGFPKFNLIFFNQEKTDTIIEFIASIGLYDGFLKDDPNILKGGCKIAEQYVAVYYSHLNNLDNILNEEVISREYIEKVNPWKNYEGDLYDWDYLSFYPCQWRYKLSGDSLIVIDKICRKENEF